MVPVPTLVRAILSIVIVGMRASLGREAAPKQIGALAAGLLTHWIRMPAPQRRLLAACGAGAGIAAVYNVPFGGAMFALEVLLGTVALPLVPPALANFVDRDCNIMAVATRPADLHNPVLPGDLRSDFVRTHYWTSRWPYPCSQPLQGEGNATGRHSFTRDVHGVRLDSQGRETIVFSLMPHLRALPEHWSSSGNAPPVAKSRDLLTHFGNVTDK